MSLEHFQAKPPLRVKKMRRDEEPEAFSGSTEPENASGGRSERLAFLRQKIACEEGISFARISIGGLGANCSFDRMLRGGLRGGALHEIAPGGAGDGAAACGFALALAVRLRAMAPGGRSAIIWIVEDFAAIEGGAPYGPGLALHGVDPAGLILVHTASAKDSLWAMEEALKCRSVAAVIGEIWSLEKIYDLTAARRLALAAQSGGASALMLAAGMAGGADRLASCAHTRFEVFAHGGVFARGSPKGSSKGSSSPDPPLPGLPLPGLPLPGLACWSVRIVKARGGAEGAVSIALLWDHEEGCFRDAFPLHLIADAGDRPGHSADARARPRQTA
jgi:protein ImuA